MIHTLAIANYRSLRSLTLSLERLNLVIGANGTGKSSLYRALRLLAETGQGSLIGSLAREGGLASSLWAGPESVSRAMRSGEHPVQGGPRKEPVHLRLGFSGPDIGYAIDLGLPPWDPGGPPSAFSKDPEIKRECIWAGGSFHPHALLVDRHAASVRVRDEHDLWTPVATTLPPYQSMLTEIADPVRAPAVLMLRERVRSWRFYDHLRADADAPARQAQIGTRTLVLGHDGKDLAAALQTIHEIGDAAALDAAVADGFPGATLDVLENDGRFTLQVHQGGLLRPLDAAELSDGTLRYLMWVAALLTPRMPELMVLNEPEASLHPDLLPALGRLIGQAAAKTQIWVITHSELLIAALAGPYDGRVLRLEKDLGETRVAGQGLLDSPNWRWPER